jgi:hypothetical protein
MLSPRNARTISGILACEFCPIYAFFSQYNLWIGIQLLRVSLKEEYFAWRGRTPAALHDQTEASAFPAAEAFFFRTSHIPRYMAFPCIGVSSFSEPSFAETSTGNVLLAAHIWFRASEAVDSFFGLLGCLGAGGCFFESLSL